MMTLKTTCYLMTAAAALLLVGLSHAQDDTVAPSDGKADAGKVKVDAKAGGKPDATAAAAGKEGDDSARPSPASGGDQGLKLKVMQAYRNANTYQSRVQFTMSQTKSEKVGDRDTWTQTTTRETWFGIAIDRERKAIRLDKPEYLIVIDEGKTRLKSDEIPGAYMEIDAPQKLNFTSLAQIVQGLADPVLPDVVMLTADDPAEMLGAKSFQELEPEQGDKAKRPRLLVDNSEGKLVFWIDPKTHLISEARFEYDTARLGEGNSMVLEYRFDVRVHNAKLSGDAFEFGTKGLAKKDSLRELVMHGQGGAGGGQQAGHPLEGRPAPAVKLVNMQGQKFELAKAAEKVVVLDFWATWCPPCRVGLPKLQKVNEWVQQEKLSVGINTINLREKPSTVAAFIKQTKLTLPVLLDSEGKAGLAYDVQSIPTTVIVANGTVFKVHVGLVGEDELKADIKAALKAAEASGSGEAEGDGGDAAD